MSDKSFLDQALGIAVDAHCGQYRKQSLMPYVVHPIRVADLVDKISVGDDIMISAAFLHDVLEDCGQMYHQTIKSLSHSVYDVVMELTHDESIAKEEYLKSFSIKSIRSLIIKVCDRVDNLRDYKSSSCPKHLKYVKKYAKKAKSLIEIVESRMKEIKDSGLVIMSEFEKLVDEIKEKMK